MEQKELTQEQREVLSRLGNVLKEARESNISFVYDIYDGTLVAYNNVNVEEYGPYAYFTKKDEVVSLNLERCSVVENFSYDYMDSSNEDYCLSFK